MSSEGCQMRQSLPVSMYAARSSSNDAAAILVGVRCESEGNSEGTAVLSVCASC